MNYFILSIVLFCFVELEAQSHSQEIKNDIVSFSNFVTTNLDSAHFYIQRAYNKSVVVQNDSLIARTSYNLGYYYYLKSDIKQSKFYLKKALGYSKKSNFHKIISLIYIQSGTIAVDENQIEKALKLYLSAYELAEKYSLFENKSRALTNLGNLYVRQKDTLKGLEFYNQNISNAQQHNLLPELINGYTNAAILYAHNDKEKAIQYYQKALFIAQEIKNLYSEYTIHINLSELYLNYKSKQNLENAYYHLQKAKNLQQQLKDPTLLFYLNFNFGGYYKGKKEFKIAIEYYKQALKFVNKNTSGNQILNLYHSLSEVYMQDYDYKNAFYFKEKQSQLSDSIFAINRNKALNEIQTKYEVDKKNLKIQLLTKEKIIEQNSRKQIFSMSLIIIIGLSIALWLYQQKLKTQKIISEKEHEIHNREIVRLEQEKELKRIIGLVEGQDQERNRIAKEIHDGIGGTLAGINLELSQLNSELKSDKIKAISIKMTKSFADLRLISHNLSLSYLKTNNLENLLEALKIGYEKRGEFQVEVVVYPPNSLKDIKEVVKHQIYRVIQELMNNVSKHAKAKTVFLSFTKHDDIFNVIVEDDGDGFDYKSNVAGIGLNNIIERLSAIKAVFTIESTVGQGTIVKIDIPISEL